MAACWSYAPVKHHARRSSRRLHCWTKRTSWESSSTALKPTITSITNIMSTISATRRTEPDVPARGFTSRSPHTYAIAFWLLTLVVFRQPLASLASLSFHDERSSHVLLIPLISAILVFL